MLIRRVVRVIAIAAATMCAACGDPFAEPIEFMLIPGAQPQFWFADYTTAASQREQQRLKGDVRTVKLDMEYANNEEPGNPFYLTGSVVMDFDELGNVSRIIRADANRGRPTELGERVRYDIRLQYELIGMHRLCVKRTVEVPGDGVDPRDITTTFAYDEAGRLIESRLGRVGDALLIKTIKRDVDGTVQQVTIEESPRLAEIRTYDRKGRLVSCQRPNRNPDQPFRVVYGVAWADDRHFRAESEKGELFVDGELDEFGVPTQYTVNYAGSSTKFDREVKFDAHGNWTELTSFLVKAREGQPPERVPFMRLKRDITYAEAAQPRE